jgi:competence protein ComEC
MFPLLWLSAAFLVGLLVAAWAVLPWTVWGVLAVAAAGLSFLERRVRGRTPSIIDRWLRGCPLPLLLVLAALLGGAARYAATRPVVTPGDLAWYNGQGEFEVQGKVVSPPEQRPESTRLRIQVQSLSAVVDGQSSGEKLLVSGLLLADVPPLSGPWRFGDILRVRGTLDAPSTGQGFSYREFLARQGIFSQLSAWSAPHFEAHGAVNPVLVVLFDLRQRAYEVTNRIFPQPEGALLSGILLGLDQDLPVNLAEAYKATGTAHIIAISGFNISILAGLFAGLFTRLLGRFLTRWWAALAAALSIAAYTLLVGAEPAVVRAAIMGGLAIFGRELGRKSAGLNVLGFSAAVMAALNPDILWNPSFQLSFGATLGLVLYADPLQEGFRKLASAHLPAPVVKRLVGPFGEYVLFTLAAQITTLPILVYHFQRLSISALLANPLVLPPQPLVMILSGVAVIVGLIWLPLGQIVAYAAWPLAAYTNRMVELLARLPGGSIRLTEVPLAWLVLFYGLLFAVTLAAKRGNLQAALKSSIVLTAAGLAAVLAWQMARSAPDGRLHLALLSLEGGTPVFVQGPGGRSLLVNAAYPAPLSDALGQRVSPFRRELDGLVLSKAQAGRGWSGLPSELLRFPAAWAAAPESLWQGQVGSEIEKQLVETGVETLNLESGTAWDLGQQARLEALTVSEQDGAALLVEWGNFRALLPGQVGSEELQKKYAARLAGLTLLVLEEKGSGDVLGAWEWLHPQAIWLAAGQEPAPEQVILVSPGGSLEAITDGSQLWLQAEP